MTWTNNFSKTFFIFASLIPFFRLIIPEKCFYQWILCHNFVYMKKFPWFLSFELGARQACDRRHRTMGTVHSGKISHLTWTFTKKYWAVLGCTGLYWAVLGHLRYLLGNVQVKWRILPLCNGGGESWRLDGDSHPWDQEAGHRQSHPAWLRGEEDNLGGVQVPQLSPDERKRRNPPQQMSCGCASTPISAFLPRSVIDH